MVDTYKMRDPQNPVARGYELVVQASALHDPANTIRVLLAK